MYFKGKYRQCNLLEIQNNKRQYKCSSLTTKDWELNYVFIIYKRYEALAITKNIIYKDIIEVASWLTAVLGGAET